MPSRCPVIPPRPADRGGQSGERAVAGVDVAHRSPRRASPGDWSRGHGRRDVDRLRMRGFIQALSCARAATAEPIVPVRCRAGAPRHASSWPCRPRARLVSHHHRQQGGRARHAELLRAATAAGMAWLPGWEYATVLPSSKSCHVLEIPLRKAASRAARDRRCR